MAEQPGMPAHDKRAGGIGFAVEGFDLSSKRSRNHGQQK
jgi:hypothetical protein